MRMSATLLSGGHTFPKMLAIDQYWHKNKHRATVKKQPEKVSLTKGAISKNIKKDNQMLMCS